MTEDREPTFEHLYRRHRAEIHTFLARKMGNRDDADDMTQAAFLNAYSAIERGSMPANPRPWLYAIAENLRRRLYRSQRGRPAHVPLEAALAAAHENGAEDPAAELHEALRRLPPGQLSVLVLREVNGLSYREIAETLGQSEPAVQMQLFRARRALRSDLRGATGGGALAWLPFSRWVLSAGQGGEALVPSLAGAARIAAAVAVVAAGTSLGGSSAAPRPVRAPAPPALHVQRAAASRPASSLPRSHRGTPSAAAGAERGASPWIPSGGPARAPRPVSQPAAAPSAVPSSPARPATGSAPPQTASGADSAQPPVAGKRAVAADPGAPSAAQVLTVPADSVQAPTALGVPPTPSAPPALTFPTLPATPTVVTPTVPALP